MGGWQALQAQVKEEGEKGAQKVAEVRWHGKVVARWQLIQAWEAQL